MTTDSAEPASASPSPPDEPVRVIVVCANCGTELRGEYCYQCGQPVKGMIRPLTSMLHDIADTIFNIDSRIFRTLWPLMVRPGYLSNEYFAGRRVRFVTPFRLYFFLTVAAFFAMQVWIADLSVNVVTMDSRDFSQATTKDEVTSQRDARIGALEEEKAAKSPKSQAKVESQEEKIRDAADKRIAYLQSVDDAKAKGQPPPPDPAQKDNEEGGVEIFGEKWTEKNPIKVAWLPDFANARLNIAVRRMRDNTSNLRKDWRPIVAGIFGVLPQVLFVVMPLFAFMLKIFFIFKRRLYMEHLIVALHSHAFIFMSLLLMTLLMALKSWTPMSTGIPASAIDWIFFVLACWLPIYLFLMQKKVYKQGWIMTTLKYCVIGLCYLFIIGFGAGVAFIVSLATT